MKVVCRVNFKEAKLFICVNRMALRAHLISGRSIHCRSDSLGSL